MELKLKLMADKQFKFFSNKNFKKIGFAAFLFFLIKGIAWLIFGGSLITIFVVDF
tara:strand:+ start:18 stop:182 length:165 start_codon:yes stop_codon:yes gene_type:complete